VRRGSHRPLTHPHAPLTGPGYLDSLTVAVAFRVLGPLQVLVDGLDVTPPAPKERALLAMLVLNRGRVVSADRIIEELWPKLGADRARRVVQVRVAAVRRLLKDATGASMLQFVTPGYRLDAAPDEIDEHRFFSLVDRARRQSLAGDPAGASASLRKALGLWRGDPLADVQTCVSLEAEAARLAEARVDAIEDCVDAELACGQHQALVSELDGLVSAHPLRERLWGQRVLALYRCGRQAEALRACTSIRRRLVDELGVEPGPALRALETAVLEQRPELDWSVGTDTDQPVGSRPPVRSDRRPDVRYAKTADGVSIAYQVAGDGPIDLIILPGFVSHLDNWWEAWSGRLVRRLASFSRLILFDKRGMGLSDRPPHVDVEHWVEDTRTVLDAVGSKRAAILGVSAGGTVAILFAAIYPDRVHSLVLYGGLARLLRADDYPMGILPEVVETFREYTEQRWGSGVQLRHYCPSVADDPAVREQFGKFQRMSASPGAASTYLRALTELDVRHALPMNSAPTLV
jgi:DNA-binding SARP family transcriptional activator/pimeloyl-ACP methyl ester carboxylesterase